MNLQILKRLWRSLEQDPLTRSKQTHLRPLTRRTFTWMILAELLVLLEVYPIKLLIDALTAPAGTRFFSGLSLDAYVACIIGVVLVLYTTENIVQSRMDILRNSAGWLFYIIICGHGARKQLSLGADFHTANSTSKKESSVSKNHKKVDTMTDYFIFDILPLTVRIVLIAIGIFLIGWQFGLLATLTITGYLAWAYWTEGKLAPLRLDYRSYTKRIEQSETEISSAAMAIKEQGLERELGRDIDELLLEHWEKEVPRHAKFRNYIWRQDQLLVLSRGVFFAISYLAWRQGTSIGTIVLANAWMERIYSNVWRYGAFQYVMNEGSEALKELVTIFELKSNIIPPQEPKWPAVLTGNIKLENLSFTYPGANRPALSNINLEIRPGQTVAFVGPSGGGKSTLARLILHQYEPDNGEVIIDGINLRHIDDHRYRREILSSVPQEPGLFDRSVSQNIGMVKAGSTTAQIRLAAEKADAAPFIEQLPQGFDTLVGERGVMLSGGQRQRVAIARALLRKSPIMVLDEPTSALDAESQLSIKRTLEEIATSREATVLIIAHRFSTIEMADIVVVMDEGRISEIGTHEELARQNGLYSRLRQLEGLLD